MPDFNCTVSSVVERAMTLIRFGVLPIVGATALVSVAAAQQPAKPPATTAAPAGDTQPTLLGQYADWGAYTASRKDGKVCFALSKPISSKTEPAGRKREPTYIFVATRPAESVKNELSVIIGYPFKSTSDATAEIGTAKFEMRAAMTVRAVGGEQLRAGLVLVEILRLRWSDRQRANDHSERRQPAADS
jgi:hypothetical protein